MSKRRAQNRRFQKFCRKDGTLALGLSRPKRCSTERKLSQITDAQARRGSYLPRSQRVALSHAGDSMGRGISEWRARDAAEAYGGTFRDQQFVAAP
jgi:hypothetical protein